MTGATSPSGWLLAILLAAASPGAAAEQEAKADFDRVERQWSEAVDSLMGYTAARKEEAMATARDTLSAMDARLDRLEARTQEEWSRLNESARQERRELLRTLRRKRSRLAEWYGGMKATSDAAWEDVKLGFGRAYDDLADAMGRAVDRFGDDDKQ